MNILEYLAKNFYTRSQLTLAAGIGLPDLDRYQQQEMMPKASYVIRGNILCNSCFGESSETIETGFYPPAYVGWLDSLKSLDDPETAFSMFRHQYKSRIAQLLAQGFVTDDEKMRAGLDTHIEAEWTHFLNGTYGLCTKSGLPDDIAAKELAIIIIKEITLENSCDELDPSSRVRLAAAVDLLDAASSAFAPHELARSSRHRFVNEVRATYRLPN